MERIVIFGGTGFIGTNLVKELCSDYEVVVISRHKRTAQKYFGDYAKVERLRKSSIDKTVELVNGSKAIINLAGENVGARWSESKMDKIRDSRLDVDSIVVRVIRLSNPKPKVLIQGSAIGIYGYSRTDIDITEDTPFGQRGFLTKLAKTHEEAVEHVKKDLRLVYIRTGMVLGIDGGALPKLMQQYNSMLGGKFGTGNQWNSWIHIDDQVKAIRYLIENDECSGPYNLTAPNPVMNKDFSKSLSQAMGKPNFFSVPSFILQLFLGSMAKELLLSGVKVLPQRLTDEGFKFRYNNLDSALENLLDNS